MSPSPPLDVQIPISRCPAPSRVSAALLLLALILGPLTAASFAQAERRRARRPAEARQVPQGPFAGAGPDLGDRVPDFSLTDTEGRTVSLADLWSQAPLVLVLGSYTCPEFREHVADLGRMSQAHGERARIVVLYTLEADPSGSESPYPDRGWAGETNAREGYALSQPEDLEGRMKAARLAVEKLVIPESVRVLVDGTDNAAWKAYGPAPHSAFLIDRFGYVVSRQGLFDPATMEQSLGALLARQEVIRTPAAGERSPGRDGGP